MLKKYLKRFTITDLVVKRRWSPRVKIVVAALAATAVIGGATFIYNYGLSMAGFERTIAEETNTELAERIAKIEAENQELRENLARAQRTVQMDQAAYHELDLSLKNSAQEVVRLREELNFYRNIISPADKKGGLRIQRLYIESTRSDNKFRYKLVLIQALKHERTIYGSARFEIRGMQSGQETVLRFPGPNERPISVNFKYFQDIEGNFELPRNFQPLQIRVNVTTAGGAEGAEATYPWPQA